MNWTFVKSTLPLSALFLAACAAVDSNLATTDAVDGSRAQTEVAAERIVRLAPPVAKQVPHTIVSAHGERSDPYFWLRDDKRTNPDMLAYLKAENAYSEQYFAPWSTLQAQLFQELKGRIKEDDSSVPVLEDGYWYYVRFETGKQYGILARRKGDMTAKEQILVDGNERSLNKEFYQRASAEVSEDGRWMAVTEDFVGRRQFELRIRDLNSGEWLPTVFSNVDAALAWGNDNKTLFFVEKDLTTLLPYKVRRWQLGSNPDQATTVYEEKDNTFYTSVYRTKSDDTLMLYMGSTLTSEARFLDANTPTQPFRVFLPRERGHEYQIDRLGDEFFVLTNWQAKNFRLMRAPVAAGSNKLEWRDVVPTRNDAMIDDFELFRDKVVIGERSGGLRKIRIKSLRDGTESMLSAEEATYVMSVQSTPNLDSGKLRYSYSSLTTPNTVLEYDFATGARAELKQDQVLGGFNSDQYQSEFVFAPARDGAQVPVSLVYRKGFQRGANAPLYIRAYGSYGASSDPFFGSNLVSLLDRGFVVAIAHIRGGQEMGRAWYEDGKLLRKQNTFNDFVDVTDHLIKQGYGARDRVFAQGGSAGGLLMGAVMNMAGDRYRGIIANVPFVDVMSTMEDASIPLTTGEYDEWGNPANAQSYAYMLSYSPYDNVRAKTYPALYVTTGLWDSQVQYFEPAKWVARLRAMKTDQNPILFKINMSAGHGGKSGRFQRLEEVAQEYAFILSRLPESSPSP